MNLAGECKISGPSPPWRARDEGDLLLFRFKGIANIFQCIFHNFYLPGEVIGLEAIKSGFYPYSAMAVTASSVCEIPFDHMLAFVSETPTLQKHLINAFSQRINLGQYITAPTAEQRLASFILDMAQRLNFESTNQTIELPMSRYDIGNFLGLAPETISRLFTRFQQAKLVSVQNKKIKLLDAANLQWMAQDGFSTQQLTV